VDSVFGISYFITQDCSGKKNIIISFPDFGPNTGPGRLPLDSGRGDVEFAMFLLL